ncbi:cation transporter [Rhizobium sp. Root1203]|uniref:TonB-dependent hemoglobin/transferrin/lactoferrin family receptor n=1 Tax=Rhizobium sp. Root1203 TaxID=1736427 RepID=UPI00070B9385|nr:TonB-dependent hemoglobin/transferrin/lactoferrin family receptor [Rhizobium sp. Root1203]KQV30691.1 cation transporter [Rhizobium sp. Root1203]
MIIQYWRSMLLVSAASIFVLPVSQAFAQSAPATTTAAAVDENGTPLQKIVVKGNRRTTTAPAGSIADTPLATEIGKKELEQQQITNFEDIGRSIDPRVNFSRADAGVNLRGLSGPRILTVIDGIPIPYLSNNARQGAFARSNANGSGSDLFDFSSLSAFDVVAGSDSSTGGSGMLGGAIVVRTLEPEDIIPEGRDWGLIVKSTYDSEDESIAGSVAAAKKIDQTSILLQGTYRTGHEIDNQGTNDSYGRSRTEPNPLDFDQSNLMVKIRQELEGGHRIGLTAESFRRDADIDLRSDQGLALPLYRIGGYNGTDDRSRKRVSFDYDYEAVSSDSFFTTARATLYWQELERSSGSLGRTAAGVGYGRDNSISSKTWGATGNATKEFEYGGYDHSVSFGLETAVTDWSQYSWALCTTTCPSLNNQAEVPDVQSYSVGATIEDRISFGNGFALTPGARFDWYRYEPAATGGFASNPALGLFGPLEDKDGARVSPKLLATYDITPDVELFAQWSMSFRAPTVDELYSRFYNAGGRYAQLGNPDLKPETGNGFEIGANFNQDDLSGRVALFHNRYKNFIDTVQTSVGGITEFNYTNVSSVTISGVEASAMKSFDNGFNIHAALAYAYGKNEDTDKRLRTVAPFKAIVGAGYSQESYGIDLSMTASAAMSDDGVVPDTTFDAPGYGVVDLTGWWTPESLKGLRVQAGIYNIFDQKYFNAIALRDLNPRSTSNQPIDYYSEPGRTFKISLTKIF